MTAIVSITFIPFDPVSGSVSSLSGDLEKIYPSSSFSDVLAGRLLPEGPGLLSAVWELPVEPAGDLPELWEPMGTFVDWGLEIVPGVRTGVC